MKTKKYEDAIDYWKDFAARLATILNCFVETTVILDHVKKWRRERKALLEVALAGQKLRIAEEEAEERFHSAALARKVREAQLVLDNKLTRLHAIQTE